MKPLLTLPKEAPRDGAGLCIRRFDFASQGGRDAYLERAKGRGVPYLLLAEDDRAVILGALCRADDPTTEELTR